MNATRSVSASPHRQAHAEQHCPRRTERRHSLWDRDISRYIYSNRIPVFNPLEDYLYDLPHWDGKDRILALAQTVPCNNPYWAELFHRWFLNMVAHWRGNTDKKYANSVSPYW